MKGLLPALTDTGLEYSTRPSTRLIQGSLKSFSPFLHHELDSKAQQVISRRSTCRPELPNPPRYKLGLSDGVFSICIQPARSYYHGIRSNTGLLTLPPEQSAGQSVRIFLQWRPGRKRLKRASTSCILATRTQLCRQFWE